MDAGSILGIICLIILVWLGLGIYSNEVNEFGAVEILKKLKRVSGPGGYGWAPFLFSKVYPFTTKQLDRIVELPPIVMGGMHTSLYLGEGYSPRTFAQMSLDRQKEIAGNPLNQQMSIEIKGIAFLRLQKETLFEILMRFGSLEELDRQFLEASKIALHGKLGRITTATLIEFRDEVSIIYTEKLRDVIRDWGASLLMAHIGSIKLPAEIESANRGVAIAVANKLGNITTAEGERERLRLVGVGRAEGIDSLREVMVKDGGKEAAALALGTEAFKGSNVDLIVTPDSITGALAGLRTILK